MYLFPFLPSLIDQGSQMENSGDSVKVMDASLMSQSIDHVPINRCIIHETKLTLSCNQEGLGWASAIACYNMYHWSFIQIT